MATITGRRTFYPRYNSNFNDELRGTSEADTISGLGGADSIYAGAGADTVYGGSGNDTLFAGSYTGTTTTGAWGADIAYGGGGDDYLFYGYTTSNVTLFGDDGAAATSLDGHDYITSGSGADTIYGGGGDDIIFGGAGGDQVYGGDGDDSIVGGKGGDVLYGGYGYDEFTYTAIGQSSATRWGSADTIMDWYQPEDYINMPTKGTASNYYERTFNSGSLGIAESFGVASQIAAKHLANTDDTYIFLTDGKNGFLFADLNGDYKVDTGIEMRGVNSLSKFGYSDII